MRRFQLHRHEDVSGVSGTGVVAQGCQFDDGTVVVRWLLRAGSSTRPTTVVHEDISNVEALHGHGGATEIVWID